MESKQYNALFSFIWNIANDVLVHAFEKGDYKKIILPFMVLRRIDVLLEPTKAAALEKKEFCDSSNGCIFYIVCYRWKEPATFLSYGSFFIVQ